MMKESEVLRQSQRAFKQWEGLWRNNCKQNADIVKKNNMTLKDIQYRGLGRDVLCCGFGYSYQENIKEINRLREVNKNFDVICIDKSLKYLGFKPDYCIVADGQVSDEWMDGVDTKGITLLMNVCANPKWAQRWEGPIVFYVNKDNIESEKIFGGISGVKECVPAASNVGNAAVVMATFVMGYKKILLTGYDFCFSNNYYAFHSQQPKKYKSKIHWMNHRVCINNAGELCYTSENLVFSSKWLSDYCTVNPYPVYNTTLNSICNVPYRNLTKQLEISDIDKVPDKVKDMIVKNALVEKDSSNIDKDDVVVGNKSIVLQGAHKWLLNM